MRAPVSATTPDAAGACAIEGCSSIMASTATVADATTAKSIFEMRVIPDLLRLSWTYYRRFSQNRTTESVSHGQERFGPGPASIVDRKSTRLNSSHTVISYA